MKILTPKYSNICTPKKAKYQLKFHSSIDDMLRFDLQMEPAEKNPATFQAQL